MAISLFALFNGKFKKKQIHADCNNLPQINKLFILSLLTAKPSHQVMMN